MARKKFIPGQGPYIWRWGKAYPATSYNKGLPRNSFPGAPNNHPYYSRGSNVSNAGRAVGEVIPYIILLAFIGIAIWIIFKGIEFIVNWMVLKWIPILIWILLIVGFILLIKLIINKESNKKKKLMEKIVFYIGMPIIIIGFALLFLGLAFLILMLILSCIAVIYYVRKREKKGGTH